MSTRTAEFAGLGEHKGKIAVGRDADLVVFDTGDEYLITADIIKYRHKITPYEGTTVKGVVRRTYLRGSVVYSEGQLTGEPRGKALLRNQL